MQDSIATASKNVARIRARKYAHYAYRGVQKAFGDRPQTTLDSLLLAPKFESASDLGDVLNRIAWYLTDGSSQQAPTVYVVADSDILLEARDCIPDSQVRYDGDVTVEAISMDEFDSFADQASRILLWEKSARLSFPVSKHLRKVEFVDPEYYSATEPNTWERLSGYLQIEDDQTSRKTFTRLSQKATEYEDAYVFATGPSLAEVQSYDIPDDALKIVCNSIVKNEELLEHIDPDVLTFADPVFHFGPSKYAATFREDAIDVLQSYDCVGVVPQVYAELLRGRYPDIEIIGMDNLPLDSPNIPTPTDRRVWATGNIMTLFMLPIATALTENVYIAGADGRKEDESYFWEHSEEAQYDDELMQTVADCHPSFFRDRIYEDYYREHVDILEEMLEYGESRGVSYHNITHSYVDCLQERQSEPPAE